MLCWTVKIVAQKVGFLLYYLFVAIYMNIMFSDNFHPFDIPDYETLTAFPFVLF